MITRLLLILLLFSAEQALSVNHRIRYKRGNCYDFTRLNFNAGMGLPYYTKTASEHGFLHRYIPSSYSNAGISLYFPAWFRGGFGIGAASTKFSFEHQVEGNFPSQSQYGIVNTKYDLKYFSIPLSLYFQPSCGPVLRIAYTPGFLVNEKYDALTFGGAATQDIAPLIMIGNFRHVQNNLSLSMAGVFRITRKAYFTLEPYLNYAFDHLEDTRTREAFRPVTAGLSINVDLDAGSIDIDPFQGWRERRQEAKRQKMEELRKRKEEAERKAREHLEQMKNQK